MILYRFVDIFRDFIKLIVKEKICPHVHTQKIHRLWITCG